MTDIFECLICNAPLKLDGETYICYPNDHYSIHTSDGKIERDYIINNKYAVVRAKEGTYITQYDETKDEYASLIFLKDIWLSLADCLNENKIKTYILFS